MSLKNIGTKPVSVKIADTVVRVAVRNIEAMYKAYHAKGGLKEMEERLEVKRNAIASGIYELAITASKLGQGKRSWVQAYFQEICKAAETGLKEKLGNVDNLKDVLPIWPVYKSEIKRAIEADIDPADFESYSALKAARIEAGRQQRESEEMRTGTRSEGEQGASEGDGNIATATGANKPTTTAKLSAVLRVMAAAIGGMDEETQDKFAEGLADLVAKYAPKAGKQTPEQEAEGKGESVAA